MATSPTHFLEATLDEAQAQGLAAHVLPDQQGLLLFAGDISIAEQCRLLQKMAAELQAAAQALPPGHQPPQPDTTPRPPAPSSIDCQVSVEERAQLFKFLTG
jgi:hypothetical protein